MKICDFRSDTVTQPTQAMREAMFHAEVGDDVYQDDPTTKQLESLATEITGKESALFVPSGTMGNQLALMSHTCRGQEAIVSIGSHIFEHEVGAAAVLSSLNLHPLTFANGIYDPAQIEAAIRPDDIHEPSTGLICLENALANGRVVPVTILQEVYKMAQDHGLPVHMDGARIFNAALALGTSVKELAACTDSISCSLSKGLCAPAGSVLCGSAAFVARARKNRKMLGGGMRQSGILAAAGILALTEMPKRLEEDHRNARRLAELLARIPGISVDPESVQINMVFASFDWPELSKLPAWLKEQNVLTGNCNGHTMRFLTHYGITTEDVEYLAELLHEFHSL